MFLKYVFTIFLILSLFIQSCTLLFVSEEKRAMEKYRICEEQYGPYKLQNTIEGYREFIARYPENIFLDDARLQIQNLEYAPYEQTNTVEGYMEFKVRYPENRHVSKANIKIEQVELKRYEKMDSIEGYREFLSKYYESPFAILAKERLQELEFREFDIILQERYRFDLLRYRLFYKRLKKKLTINRGVDLSDFACFASIVEHDDKTYFHTHLIYAANLSYLNLTSRETAELFYGSIVSKALSYLNRSFMSKKKIDGFSFDISSSPHYFYKDRGILLEYYFLIDRVESFADGSLDEKGLLATATIVSPEKMLPATEMANAGDFATEAGSLTGEDVGAEEKGSAVKKLLEREAKSVPPPQDGPGIMKMVTEREQGKDYIISRSWKMGRHNMKNIEKRIFLSGKGGFIDKTIIKYIDPPAQYGTSILIWNYEKREKAFWYRLFHADGASRVPDTERIRTPAESDFCFTDYIERKVEEEQHELLRSEDYEGKDCFVVKSTPVKKSIKYGKRISWIDQSYFIPLKIDYYNKKSELWKTLHIEWQHKYGLWFWESAVVENVQTNSRTTINLDDVRVNVGLDERDFTKHGLEQKKHGF